MKLYMRGIYTMDKIILCFDLDNCQADYSVLMQVIQAFEGERSTDQINYPEILEKVSIRYCWISEKNEINQKDFQPLEIVQNIEGFWQDDSGKEAWTAHSLTALGDMVRKKDKYQFSYYVRVKNAQGEDIRNIQYLLLAIQQFPSVCGRLRVFIEPFDNYLSAGKEEWGRVSVYYKYSHFMRFILERYPNMFYSAFFITQEERTVIGSLSAKKAGVQSTFFPLVEVDGDVYTAFSRYCALGSDGLRMDSEKEHISVELGDLLEISKKILDKRIKDVKLNEEGKKVRKEERNKIKSTIYQHLSKEKITALEYALFSVLIPMSVTLTEADVENCRKRARSISNGLIQIIENIFLHSHNRKGIFSFRILSDGKKILDNILENGATEDADRILEIDVADANIYESILDNFSKKLDDKYFSDIKLSVSHFFEKYESQSVEESWKRYRQENPVRCMGLARLAQELQLCRAVLKVRSSTQYAACEKYLFYQENNFDLSEFRDTSAEGFIPGTQYQILFPVLYSEEKKQHNANIFLNGIGNLSEKDAFYAEFVEYNPQRLAEADGRFYQTACREQAIDNRKDRMVCMWKELIDGWVLALDREAQAVYYLDMREGKEFESPWGLEAFCKGLVDSDIFYSGTVKYIALINCDSGFLQMIFDTIMISGRGLSDGLQIYLHTADKLDDLVISGNCRQNIVRNAQQYCYLKEKPLAFIGQYAKGMHKWTGQSENEMALFPFDVILCESEQSDMTLFEHYISEVAQHSLTDIDEAGYWLHDIHMRLGNKVHLQEFYEISILFRKPRIARKIALLLIRKMIKDGLQIQDNFLFYGYASYSREILTALTEIVRACQRGDGESLQYFVGFAVYQNDIMVQKTLTHISSKVKMYFSEEIPGDTQVKVIQVVPIISTLTTFKKMWDMFAGHYQENMEKVHLVKNYTLFWVRDLQKQGRENEPTDLEREYWNRIGGNRTIETSLISPHPQFFCHKNIQWYDPLKCKQCYSENVLDESVLVETDVTSTVPSQQLEVNLQKKGKRDGRKQIINEIRLVNMKDCIFYGHICRDGNHFQYYVDTTNYFHRQKEAIAHWLEKLQEQTKPEPDTLHIIVSPQHHTNVEFGHYVNNYYFNGKADFIVIDATKEYRSNIIAKYADVKAAIFAAAERKIKIQFTYVDDTIITGSTYRRVNNLLHSLVPKKIQKPIQFGRVFVLVNRMSYYSKMDYVQDVESDFYAFADMDISSVRNFGDSCAMCTLQKNAKLFFKRSSTTAISRYWEKKQHDYKAVTFDKYPQLGGFRQKMQEGYLRALCSHYAKGHLAISENYGESISEIISLFSDVIEVGQRKIKANLAEPLETEENIGYFESENLSPIYCCVFKRDVLAAVKAYLKVLCRPFFSYGKIYRQAILDFLLLLSQSFLAPGFDEKLLCEKENLSSLKSYMNDIGLRKKMAELCRFLKAELKMGKERRDFIREYLLEGLTDLRSNYIIRKFVIYQYKALLEEEEADYHEYYEYEKMVHRLINSSADETKSLWIEYLLITGKENATSLNNLHEIETCSISAEDDFSLFWKSLLIENTRLYYDSMLNFVQRASAFVDNKNMDAQEAIRQSVDDLWGDYYIKNLRKFVRLEILVDFGLQSEAEIESKTRDRVTETADLLYLLKRETSGGIERYVELKKRILRLLYPGDGLKILTSAFAGAQNGDELYLVTEYKKENVSATVAARVKEAINSESLENKSYYLGKDYIVLCINNNASYLRGEKIEKPKLIRIQPLYFYIECDTSNHFKVIFRIRRILMYRHQLLHWIEADFNNNAMPILAEQMGINRQLTRERAGDHNTSTDIMTIEKLLQSRYQEAYGEVYRLLLLKVYVNMRIARLFRSEWSESDADAYTLEKNEDKMNKAMRNLGEAIFGETRKGLSPKQYLMFVKDVFLFDVNIHGECMEDAGVMELEHILGRLAGRCEKGYYYKQEYIFCIIFDILFSAMKVFRNWPRDIHKFFHREENRQIDSIFKDNETIAQYYVLKNEKEKCKITIKTEEIKDWDAGYLVFKNKVYGVPRKEIERKNEEFKEKMVAKDTLGMSVQAMKWYTEMLAGGEGAKAEFIYEWNEAKQEVEFVTKLPILSKERA